jgi:hypothetical protein
MNADRLRQAAQKIRETAGAAAYGQWHKVGDLPVFAGEDAAHIALWSPPVALAVADWLDDFANTALAWTDRPGAGPVDPKCQAVLLADLILGGAR